MLVILTSGGTITFDLLLLGLLVNLSIEELSITVLH